jgi:hypothetical protein
MKKLAIALLIALIAIAVVAVPALAYEPPEWDQDASASVTYPGGIDVTDENPVVGTTIIFSGTVHIDASSHSDKNYPPYAYKTYDWDSDAESWYTAGAYAKVTGSAYYVIYGTDGVTIKAQGDTSSELGWTILDEGESGHWDGGTWVTDEDVSASFGIDGKDYTWSASVFIDEVGDYTAEEGGEASAEYGMWIQYGHFEGCCLDKHFVADGDPIYVFDIGGFVSAEPDPISRTVTSHAGVMASTSYIHPYLVIKLPDGSKHFFGKDGWGDPTTQDIAYTDGTWQVEIQDGTIIQLDGTWHKTTYLDVDNEGNVTGRYDAGGSTVAEEIGLSQPITITKVG